MHKIMATNTAQHSTAAYKVMCEHCMPWSVYMCVQSFGNAMNVQLAPTNRQAYTTTHKTPSHTYVGCTQLRIYTPLTLQTVTIYPTAEPTIL